MAAVALPRSLYASTCTPRTSGRPPVAPHFLLEDPAWRAFAQRGLDAAREAGAQYADVRLTRTLNQGHVNGTVSDLELLGVGVRALVDGCWGFASSPYWQGDEPVLLGRMAAQEARTVARVTPRDVALSARPTASGTWVMPVKIDPFTVSFEEKRDFFESWQQLVLAYRPKRALAIDIPSPWGMSFTRQEQAVATSDGSYVTQVVFDSSLDGPVRINFDRARMVTPQIGRSIKRVDASGAGWELMLEAQIPDQCPSLCDEALELALAPMKPAEPGRFDVVFDAATTARLVDQSFGTATELDRALGDEANATGTSFLGPDLAAVLGQPVGSPLVTVTGDRHMARGLATVRWDAEGVEPDVATIVNKGLLSDYQTTRALATQLAAWYAQQGRPMRSHGFAGAASALDVTLQAPPNLTLAPGTTETSFTDMVASVSKGLVVQNADVTTDFQAKYGVVKGGTIREIKGGKIGAVVRKAGLLFNTTELWKNVRVAGGAASAAQFPASRRKGEPVQTVWHSVRAVPMLVQNVAVFDVSKR
jgi:TldD protein